MDFTEIKIGEPDGPFYKYCFSQFHKQVRGSDTTQKGRARSWLSFVVGKYNKGSRGFPVDHQIVSLLQYLHDRDSCKEFQLKRKTKKDTEAGNRTGSDSWGRVKACSSTEPASTEGTGWAGSIRPRRVEKEEESSGEESSDDLSAELADLARSLAELSLKLHKKKKK